MATAPVKPQPLHNFPLSLKWGQTATAAANHRHPTPEPDETESDDHEQPTTRPRVGSRSARLHRVSFSSCSTAAANLLKNPIPADDQKQKAPVLEAEVGEEDGNLRPWRLRPRRGILAQPSEHKDKEKENDAAHLHHHHQKHHHHHQTQQQLQQHVQQPKSMRLRGLAESSAAGVGGGAAGGGPVDEKMKKKEKSKVWISLSRDEIEEDIFIMTGSRPSRRPRKRPKSIQKVLDNVFPGLWLVGASADSYRVVDTPIKTCLRVVYMVLKQRGRHLSSDAVGIYFEKLAAIGSVTRATPRPHPEASLHH